MRRSIELLRNIRNRCEVWCQDIQYRFLAALLIPPGIAALCWHKSTRTKRLSYINIISIHEYEQIHLRAFHNIDGMLV